MGVLNKLNMLRRSFETALDLIDAIALEYYFINNTIDVKTKLAEGHSYMFGTYIQNALEYIYDPEQGDPESGIEPGTAFEDIPDDWTCPLCGVGKEDFEPYEG